MKCLSGKESACNADVGGICRLNPWVGKIPQRSKGQPIPVFLPKTIPIHGVAKESDMTGY